MARESQIEMPADLRARLEAARLDLLSLFRALDRMDLSSAEIPQRLIRHLFEPIHQPGCEHRVDAAFGFITSVR